MRTADGGPSGAFAEVPGARLWFVDTRNGDIPVVLLHANTGTSASWHHQIAAFAEAGYRVIAFDRRGWGRSVAVPASGPQPGTIATDLDALADHLDLPSFHLVAVAGGTFAALDYAAWRPGRVRSLVAAVSMGAVQEPEIQDFVSRIEIPTLRAQSALYREVGPSFRGADPEGTQRWVEVYESAKQPDATIQPMRTPNTFAKLATISAPTLVLAGGADLIAPPALMRLWSAHIPGHEWAIVPEAGHSIAQETPAQFNEIVLAFLNKHTAKNGG
ncbi:alpha/beta fold hydrolase [Mesorhizobium sp. ZC-5]|uniref:alpha/beta fold hydrolase n=1 Tax=Mesorhizobium sp. ZC-5 TaxID=2986066 RepID=UPI0021E6ED93|nr:alpha/beta hydrolase [Mesorhizobium sp. ZC-5]MCV3242684.1 alpha/beta hydrolase [Mesorhizobium sp. ZC-5]